MANSINTQLQEQYCHYTLASHNSKKDWPIKEMLTAQQFRWCNEAHKGILNLAGNLQPVTKEMESWKPYKYDCNADVQDTIQVS